MEDSKIEKEFFEMKFKEEVNRNIGNTFFHWQGIKNKNLVENENKKDVGDAKLKHI